MLPFTGSNKMWDFFPSCPKIALRTKIPTSYIPHSGSHQELTSFSGLPDGQHFWAGPTASYTPSPISKLRGLQVLSFVEMQLVFTVGGCNRRLERGCVPFLSTQDNLLSNHLQVNWLGTLFYCLKIFIYLFWLRRVLVAARGIFLVARGI